MIDMSVGIYDKICKLPNLKKVKFKKIHTSFTPCNFFIIYIKKKNCIKVLLF